MIRAFLCLLVGLYLSFLFAQDVFAESIPATQNPPAQYKWLTGAYGAFAARTSEAYSSTDFYPAGQAHCEAVAASGGKPLAAPVTPSFNGFFCRIQNSPTNIIDILVQGQGVCPPGSTRSGTYPNATCVGALVCPAGYTLNGNMCERPDCPLGTDRDASGQCVKDCTAKAGMALPNTHYRVGESGAGAFGGCKFKCATRVKYSLLIVGDPDSEAQGEWVSTDCRYTGVAATTGDLNAEGTGTDVPPPDKPTKPDDCLARGMGYIQSSTGQTSCVSGQDAPEGQKPDQVRHDTNSSSGSTGTDGNPDPNAPDYKETTTSTTSKGGDVVVNTQERVKQPGYDQGNPQPCPEGFASDGSGFCVKTTAQKEKEAEYCRNNPEAAICKLSNTGSTKPTGTGGDKKGSGTCKEGDTSAACAKLDNAPIGDEIPSTSIGVTAIAPVSVAASGSCPQGPAMPFGIGYMPMDGICSLASGIRPIILALAWLSAGLIVVGAFRET